MAVTACADRTVDTSRLQSDPSAPPTAEAVRSIYADRTLLTYDRFHGTQIEFHGANGRSVLWYPGNTRGVPANWRVEMGENGHDICWQYPSSAYNPWTKEYGGRWECTPDWAYFPGVVQIVEGDPFGLASGRVPFQLPKRWVTAEDLASVAGIPKNRVKVLFASQ